MKRVSKVIVAASAALIMAVGAGCSSGGTSGTSVPDETGQTITLEALEGTWDLEGASGPEGVLEDLPPATLTVEADGRYGFEGSCNGMGGQFKVEDGVLSTDENVMTLMACDGVLGQLDGIASTTFSGLEAATLTESGVLTLVGDGSSLIFQKQ